MRYLPDVIRRIEMVIPPTQMELLHALRDRKKSASYAAPEMQTMWWNLTYETLCEYVFNEDKWKGNYWQEELRKIWTGEK
jgi:hypothetical protein